MTMPLPPGGGTGYTPFHQRQTSFRCGIHAINNALGNPTAVTVFSAEEAGAVMAKKEAEFLKTANPVRPHVLPGGNMLGTISLSPYFIS